MYVCVLLLLYVGDAQYVAVGDQIESASPADASFWVIHPNLERLFHAKMLSGAFETTEWPSDQVNDHVCDKSYCYSPSNGSFGYFDECCYGHYEDSRMLDGFKSSFTVCFDCVCVCMYVCVCVRVCVVCSTVCCAYVNVVCCTVCCVVLTLF